MSSSGWDQAKPEDWHILINGSSQKIPSSGGPLNFEHEPGPGQASSSTHLYWASSSYLHYLFCKEKAPFKSIILCSTLLLLSLCATLLLKWIHNKSKYHSFLLWGGPKEKYLSTENWISRYLYIILQGHYFINLIVLQTRPYRYFLICRF